MTTLPKPQKITTLTAKHRYTGDLEHYRSRDLRASRETMIARFGHYLSTLGWQAKDIMIVSVHTEREDHVTQAIRNRMIRPRA